MSAVSTMLEWPSISCTTFSSTPADSARLAAPWRRSCSRIGGNLARAVSYLKVRVSRSGAIGSPFRQVNTYPLSR